MAVVGSIFTLTFENCFCFLKRRHVKSDTLKAKKVYEERLISLQDNMDIKVLPFLSFMPLTDIFPEKNHVQEWSVYVIGRNKRMVMAQDNLNLSGGSSMLNKKYDTILAGKNGEFFDLVFDMIVNGHETQFLMVVQNELYFANTYTFLNEEKKSIGGILFIRLYSSLDELTINPEDLQKLRKSKEYERAMRTIHEHQPNDDMP